MNQTLIDILQLVSNSSLIVLLSLYLYVNVFNPKMKRIHHKKIDLYFYFTNYMTEEEKIDMMSRIKKAVEEEVK